jgi:hypothetical protein
VKRIMSFDGGGIRGMFSLQIAKRLEALLRESHGRPDLVLADVVDLFAGTSTGAIIATALAWGMSVAEVEALYFQYAQQMFSKERWWRRLRSKYRGDTLEGVFRNTFAEQDGRPAVLGTKKLKALVLLVMRNATTGSPWPISSNPHAMFNDESLADCNLGIPLWQLLRASTAAPTFFPAQEITFGERTFLFVDGGITPFNNPALLAIMMATLPCYRLDWPTGRDAMHVLSLGTGSKRARLSVKAAKDVRLWHDLEFVIPALIGSAADNQDMVCRALGDCLHGAALDAEIGRLDAPSLLAAHEQKFSYVRYDAQLDAPGIQVPLSDRELELDNLDMLKRWQDIGREYAREHVQPAHLWPRSGYPTAASPAQHGV